MTNNKSREPLRSMMIDGGSLTTFDVFNTVTNHLTVVVTQKVLNITPSGITVA